MPAKSKAQRRLFALALKYKNGDIKTADVSDDIVELSKLPEDTLRDFAKTEESDLPQRVNESIIESEKLIGRYISQVKNKFKLFLDKIKTENSETKEAYRILVGSIKSKQKLSHEEREQIGNQLKDVLKLAGFTAASILPGGFIYILLTRITFMKKHLLPSTFLNNDKIDETQAVSVGGMPFGHEWTSKLGQAEIELSFIKKDKAESDVEDEKRGKKKSTKKSGKAKSFRDFLDHSKTLQEMDGGVAASPTNTTGMGNVTPGDVGSGDKWGDDDDDKENDSDWRKWKKKSDKNQKGKKKKRGAQVQRPAWELGGRLPVPVANTVSEKLLNEGGWSTEKTQNTVLNPIAIKEGVDVMETVGRAFNEYLKTIDLPEMGFGQPVGSGTWWKDDLENNPTKIYGDIDLLITYPVLGVTDNNKKNEAESIKIYNAEFLKWLKTNKPKAIDVEETEKVSNPSTIKLITKVPSGYVQIDMVATHEEYKDWASARLTPVRNIKGFVLGNLYTSFGKTLDVSIQLKGVRAKIKDGMVVPYSKRSGVEEILISNSMKTFMYDIAKFIWEKSTDQKFDPSKDLVNWSMNSKSPSIEDLIKGIKAVVNTLDKLDEWGSTIKYKSKKDFLNAVVKNYEDVMMKNYSASKFNKAQSQQALKTVKKIRETISNNISLVKSLI